MSFRKIFNVLVLKVAFVFVLLPGLLYLIINFQTLINKVNYDAKVGSALESVNQVTEKASGSEEIATDHINIPKINVQAPVVYNTGLENEEIIAKLQEGVVFYSSSSLPNEEGLAIYFGHSSNYWWRRGEYDAVFSSLSKLDFNDEIRIYYAGQEYYYQVAEKKIINKKDWEQLTDSPVQNGLALVTCWPIGTTWQRYVVWANRAD